MPSSSARLSGEQSLEHAEDSWAETSGAQEQGQASGQRQGVQAITEVAAHLPRGTWVWVVLLCVCQPVPSRSRGVRPRLALRGVLVGNGEDGGPSRWHREPQRPPLAPPASRSTPASSSPQPLHLPGAPRLPPSKALIHPQPWLRCLRCWESFPNTPGQYPLEARHGPVPPALEEGLARSGWPTGSQLCRWASSLGGGARGSQKPQFVTWTRRSLRKGVLGRGDTMGKGREALQWGCHVVGVSRKGQARGSQVYTCYKAASEVHDTTRWQSPVAHSTRIY